MTNRQHARSWLLDTFPSTWEAEHIDSLTALLNEVSRRARERALQSVANDCQEHITADRGRIRELEAALETARDEVADLRVRLEQALRREVLAAEHRG